MTRKQLYEKNRRELLIRHSYKMVYFDYFDFSFFKKIMTLGRNGKNKNLTYNDVIIMLDTETSKETPGTVCRNYIVAWTISVRAYDMNLVTLYGTRPSECIECINRMIMNMSGNMTVIYIHNLPYDWTFLRKFMLAAWGTPEHQLNVKSHYPIYIEFNNGILLKDSLILAQRKLEKWSDDLDVEHKKAVGLWDYDRIRMQGERFNPQELTYIEHDTLAGVECIQKTMDALHKCIINIPFTATGIPREQVQKIGAANHAHDFFLRMVPDYQTQLKQEASFHGGYTHNNRHYTERLIKSDLLGDIFGYDFASSYPYCMLAFKYPMEAWSYFKNVEPEFILDQCENYAFMFKLIMKNVRLKNDFIPMPALQHSKCTKTLNAVQDNGRILCASYIEIYLTDPDLEVIMQQYEADKKLCVEVQVAKKDYLPKWFTDYIFECFRQKTMLKGGDPVAYSIAKARLNSLYGMCVQKPIKETLEEAYHDMVIDGEPVRNGSYIPKEDDDPVQIYEKYKEKRKSVLPYIWGVYVTSYAFRNLFKLGECFGTWLYSDTDSCYGLAPDTDKIKAYNNECIKRIADRGYKGIVFNNKTYHLGVAELDGIYSEFISVGAKRYAVRCADNPMWANDDPKKDMRNKIKITVAGVPKKKGALCLKDDLRNFHAGFIFDGITTGKLTHSYFYEDDIMLDQNNNEMGDSIDLSPCDYKLDSVRHIDWEKYFEEEIQMQVYDEE